MQTQINIYKQGEINKDSEVKRERHLHSPET
jgi:hypothetical protein